MSISGVCLGSYALAPGLTATYSSVNKASVTGTPTGSLGTVPINVTVYSGGCGSGFSNPQSTSLIIQNSGGGPVAPSMLVAPQSVLAQVGSDVILSGGAGGNPTPGYYWKQGITLVGTGNTLTIPSAQLANGGLYTLYATNSQGLASSACYLTMALTPGSNILAFNYTNYIVAGTPLTMSSMLTNAPTGVSTYAWNFNGTSLGVTNNNLSLTSAKTTPSKSGTYEVVFNSTVSGNSVVINQPYDSYWVFGYLPSITSQPTGQTVGAGSNATFNITLTGSTYPNVFLYQNQTNLVAQTNLSTFNPSSGATTTSVSMTISNLTQANAGTVRVRSHKFLGHHHQQQCRINRDSIPVCHRTPKPDQLCWQKREFECHRHRGGADQLSLAKRRSQSVQWGRHFRSHHQYSQHLPRRDQQQRKLSGYRNQQFRQCDQQRGCSIHRSRAQVCPVRFKQCDLERLRRNRRQQLCGASLNQSRQYKRLVAPQDKCSSTKRVHHIYRHKLVELRPALLPGAISLISSVCKKCEAS